MENKLKHKKIIITGASSGIGERLALNIAKNGGIPILIARSADKLNALKESIQKTFQIECFVYVTDLEDSKAIDALATQILIEHEEIHGLINNAGMGIFDYVADLNLEDATRMFELNVLALIRLTKLFLPRLAQNYHAHIINIASQAGKLATPKSSVYAATKHAVLGFTNALRLEVADQGIFVTAVNVGPVRTKFFELADPEGTYLKNINRMMLDPDDIAKKVVEHMFTKRREINMPWWMEVGSKLYGIFPSGMEVILKRQFNKK